MMEKEGQTKSWCTTPSLLKLLGSLSLLLLLFNIIYFFLDSHQYTVTIHNSRMSNASLHLPTKISTSAKIINRNITKRPSPARARTYPVLCPKMTIHSQGTDLFDGMACRPRMPTEASCNYTAKSFKASSSILLCKDQKEPPYEMCWVSKEKRITTSSTFLFKCNFSVCNKTEGIFVKDLDPTNGELREHLAANDTAIRDTILEVFVADIALAAWKNGFPFIFINCTANENGTHISQLLDLLPKLQHVTSQEKPQNRKVNVNVVLLDSISRAHFYRSLRKTVKYLRQKQVDTRYEAHALDFELFQAIHGHTHENEHAFFGGELYPANYSEQEIGRSPTNPEVLFGIFKRAGYQTMYMEDMCWKSYYGLMASFKARGWKSLQYKLNTSNIDSTGIIHSSCNILNRYGSNTQFYANKDHQICFNGKHYHSYFLDYLTRYVEAVVQTPRAKPFFSFTALNVAHDHVGIRVQTLDEDLMNFIDAMSKQANTITIIYADHGNTYTYYQVKMIEGRLEMYHPMMLAVVPKRLEQKLGERTISNLKTNQQRLFTLLDVRAGIVELAKYDGSSNFKPAGIFDGISKKRICRDLALTKASICICTGSFVPVKNSTMQMAIAEFAIGQLNNKIQDMFQVSRKRNNRHWLFGFCQRLRIQSFTNMRQRQTPEGRVLTSMDIEVQSADILKQAEIFTVNVESNGENANKYAYEMKLVAFERVSTFGPYKQCADDNVELKLCICKKRVVFQSNSSAVGIKLNMTVTKSHPIYAIIQKSSNITRINPCLVHISRSFFNSKSQDKYGKLKVHEMANICEDKSFTVEVNTIERDDVISSIKLPKKITLQRRSIYFLTCLKARNNLDRAKLNLHIRIVNVQS